MADDLAALFSPRAIAVVGASEGPRHGGEVMRSLRDSGYAGRIVPVNPSREEVYGIPCVPSLEAVEGPVDCVVLAVRREEVARQLAAAARIGARGAVIVAGGFREADAEGAAIEAEILAIARANGIRVLGPNTIGFANAAARVGCYAASLPAGVRPGPVAAALQSGTVAGAVGGAGRCLRLGYLVATGNETDIDAAALVDHFADDPAVGVILLFMESVKDVPAFVAATRKASAAAKPVVALRAGRTASGRAVTGAHTGALADDVRVFEALARHAGVTLVDTMDELIVAGEVLGWAAGRRFAAPTVALMTHSGGEAAHFADLCEQRGLPLATLAPATVACLRAIFPAYHTPGNPLDITGLGATDAEVFRASLEALCDDEGVGIVAVMQDIRSGHRALMRAVAVTAEVAGRVGKPIVFFSNTTRHFDPDVDGPLDAAGVPVLYGTSEVIRALHAVLLPRTAAADVTPAALCEAEVVAAVGEALSGAPARLLEVAGITTPASRTVTDADDALAAARAIGFPVALKAGGIAHKTEVGGVALGIADEAALAGAIARMVGCAGQPSHFLVQGMIGGPTVELIVGIERDPVYGWYVLAGAGGILAEVLDDVAIRIAPVDEAEAEEMLRGLRISRLLAGYRGGPAMDVAAAAAAIASLSRLAPHLEGRLAGLEINPLAVLPAGEGAVALDILPTRGADA